MDTKAVVLFSSGMDSTTLLTQVLRDHVEVLALTLHYGNTHRLREVSAAAKIVEVLSTRFPGRILRHEIRALNAEIFRGGHSALLQEVEIPTASYQDPAKEGPSPTVVPFRNANLVSAAVAIAQARGYAKVFTAVHASDHGRWAYPDCSPEFMGAMSNAVHVGTMGEVRLRTPYIWMTKAHVVELALLVEAPLAYSFSCYRGGDIHCGNCPTCQERIEAFKEVVAADPVAYEDTQYVPAWWETARELSPLR